MKYYLVANFNNDSNAYIEELQKRISKKYKLSNDFPKPSITLEILESPDLDKLTNAIEEALRTYKKFKIKLNSGRFYNSGSKTVELKVESEGYIVKLARKLNETFIKHGFSVKELEDNPEFFIQLINSNTVPKDFTSLANTAEELDTKLLITVDKLELLKTLNNRKKVVVKSYAFKTF